MNLIERAYAQANISPITTSSDQTLWGFLNGVTRVLGLVAGSIAVIYLIYSGILYLTAAGNPDAAKKGQQGIVNAVIGIIVIVLAYVIVSIAAGTAKQIGSGV